MPLQFALNNQQYELFSFVVHLSQSANEGHYIAYHNCNGIWSEYNDNIVTSSVAIDGVKDKAYYYCYRRVSEDYDAFSSTRYHQNGYFEQTKIDEPVIIPMEDFHEVSNKFNITGPVADADGNHIYATNSTHQLLAESILGKRKGKTLHVKSSEISECSSQVSRKRQANDIDPTILQGEYYCSLCRNYFNSFGSRFQHYQNCVGLKMHYEVVKQQMQTQKNKVDIEEQKKIQTVIDFSGNILRGVVDSVNLIKELMPTEKKATQIYGDDYKELLQLHKELHSKDCFKGGWLELVAGPVADANGNPVYAQYATRENLVKVLGKRRRCTNTKIAREVITKAKQELGIPLTLVEQKAKEQQNIFKLVKYHSGLFRQFHEWMLKYKGEKVLNHQNPKKFEWVGLAFCDGIIVPKLPFFDNNSEYQAFLQKHGKLQIQKMSESANNNCLYVRLLDSANQFTEKLIEGFNEINKQLLTEMDKYIISHSFLSCDVNEMKKNCCIRQVDYTRDMKGAFYSFQMKLDLNALQKLLDMRKATHNEYTSIDSCFQFLKHAKGEPKQLRMKLYNKIFHLVQSEQGKKKVSMNLKALFGCSAAFFEKIDQCLQEGLSRCEFSQYFNSADDLSEKLKFDGCIFNLENALNALNQVPSVYNTIPIIPFLDDYFETFASNLFIFEQHQWAVVYGKNRSSSYTGIIGNPCKMGKEEFIARYTHNNTINIIDNTDQSGQLKNTLVSAERIGPQIMQIPMQSLGVAHKINNQFDLNQTKLRLGISEGEIGRIKIIDKEANMFFKAEQKIQKACKTLKRKAPPFSEAQPKKRQRFDKQDQNSFQQQIDQFNFQQYEGQASEPWEKQEKQKKQQEIAFKEKQQWVKKGFHKGKQRWWCSYCEIKTTVKFQHVCFDNLH